MRTKVGNQTLGIEPEVTKMQNLSAALSDNKRTQAKIDIPYHELYLPVHQFNTSQKICMHTRTPSQLYARV